MVPSLHDFNRPYSLATNDNSLFPCLKFHQIIPLLNELKEGTFLKDFVFIYSIFCQETDNFFPSLCIICFLSIYGSYGKHMSFDG
jgi:hypothetical protein